MTRSQEVQVTQRPQIFHHLLSVSLLLAMFRMSLVPSTIMTQWNTQNQQSFARFNTWAHLPKQALQRPQVEQERGCFFPTETIWWYSTYPNAKGSASLFFLQVWGHDNRILQHGSSLLLSMKLPCFVLEDKKEQTSSKRNDCTFFLAIVSSSQAPSLLLQLVNTLLLGPLWRNARLDHVRARVWPPTSCPGSASPFLKSTLHRSLYKWAWTALWPLAGHEAGRLPSWEKDLWADNEDFSCCDILLCADVLSWVPWVTRRADLWLLNS